MAKILPLVVVILFSTFFVSPATGQGFFLQLGAPVAAPRSAPQHSHAPNFNLNFFNPFQSGPAMGAGVGAGAGVGVGQQQNNAFSQHLLSSSSSPTATSPQSQPVDRSADYSRLNFCEFDRNDFVAGNSRADNVCFVVDRLVVRKLEYHRRPFWCLGLFKYPFLNWEGQDDFIDIQVATGYRVEYSPAETRLERVGNSRVRFHFIPGQVIKVAIFEHLNGFPDIYTIELNGTTVCPAQVNRFETVKAPNNVIEPNPTQNPVQPPAPKASPPNPAPNQIQNAIPPNPVQNQVQRAIQTPVRKPAPNPVQSQQVDVSSCGRTMSQQYIALVSRGKDSQAGKWPWHAAIYHITLSSFSYKCGGTIVSSRAVLTAAHCLLEDGRALVPERVSIHLGKFILQKFSPQSREYDVHSMEIHPNFDKDSLRHDIAMIKLATLIEFSDYIRPVCLQSGGQRGDESQIGQVVGWGRNEAGKVATSLQEAAMRVVTHLECLESNRDFFGQFLNDDNFCAGFRNGTGVCSGDSGGGMFFQRSEGDVWFVGGVVSLGVRTGETCDSMHFTLFTDVKKYLNWIKERL